MTAFRLIPLPIHASLRMSTGLFTIAAPFLFGFGVAAAVLAVVLGAVVAGVALSAIPDDRGFTALPVSTLHALDYGFVFGTFGAAVVVGVDGDAVAATVLTAIALVQLLGNLGTRYSLST